MIAGSVDDRTEEERGLKVASCISTHRVTLNRRGSHSRKTNSGYPSRDMIVSTYIYPTIGEIGLSITTIRYLMMRQFTNASDNMVSLCIYPKNDINFF